MLLSIPIITQVLPLTSYPERMVARMGPVRAPEIAARLKAIAGGEGILMADNGVVGGTELCHVLLHLAGKISLEQQNKVAEELFRAYFEEAKDIFNAPSLVEAGVAAGMERGALEKGLEDEKALEEVRKEERENKARRGRGVPRFYMGGITIEGAKDMEDFFEAFLQIKEGRVE
jgi:predicted DsbA family dithiol-disulfide isomerase